MGDAAHTDEETDSAPVQSLLYKYIVSQSHYSARETLQRPLLQKQSGLKLVINYSSHEQVSWPLCVLGNRYELLERWHALQSLYDPIH